MEKQNNPFNFKTILAGTLFSILLVFMTQYSNNVLGTDSMALDHVPAGGVFIFLIICLLVNPLLKKFRAGAFSAPELLIIYVMLLVTASVSEVGLACHLFPMLAGLTYYATPMNGWTETIVPHIRNWLIPKDLAAVTGFFEGGMAVPYLYWIKIFIPWFLFLLALYFAHICIAALFRKQWVENEQLNFALNSLPLAMVEEPAKKGTALSPFFKNRFMWLGFSVAFLLSFSVVLNHFFPVVPVFRKWTEFLIFRNTTRIQIAISFPIIGFIFFVNSKLSFSLWFFALFFKMLEGYFKVVGLSSSEPIQSVPGGAFLSHLCFGALVAYVFQVMFLSRRHFKNVLRKALRKNSDIDDSRELLSYPAAFWGLILSFLFLVTWLRIVGMNIFVAALLILLIFIFIIGLTKVIAQGGLLTLKESSLAHEQIISMSGSKNLGANNLIHLGFSYLYHSDTRTFPLVAAIHGAKLGQKIRDNIRPLFWIILLALVLGMVASNFLLLKLAYRYGGINMPQHYFVGYAQLPWSYTADQILNPKGPVFSGMILKSLGFLFMILLSVAYNFLSWFPLHPMGFAVAASFRVIYPWFSIFIGWLLQVIFIRYGGPKTYNESKPFFLGLILGTYAAAGIWFLASLIFNLHIPLEVIYV